MSPESKQPTPEPKAPDAPEPEIQAGRPHRRALDDALKRQISRHSRDEPRIDSVEDDELPPA
jgi:hypothetical protein